MCLKDNNYVDRKTAIDTHILVCKTSNEMFKRICEMYEKDIITKMHSASRIF